MRVLRSAILPVVLSTAWVALSEFLRNQVLFASYWVEHYRGLGLVFPAAPINGAMWGAWSLLFAIVVFVITRRFSRLEAVVIAWTCGFAMMWVTIGNLGVLPFRLLIPAVPLSVLEAFLAVMIVTWLSPRRSLGAGAKPQ
jgi:Na+-transporting NADH:ubiquinone oxidoreductase subunit NqrE